MTALVRLMLLLMALAVAAAAGAAEPEVRGTGDLGVIIERAAGRIQVVETSG